MPSRKFYICRKYLLRFFRICYGCLWGWRLSNGEHKKHTIAIKFLGSMKGIEFDGPFDANSGGAHQDAMGNDVKLLLKPSKESGMGLCT